MTVIVDVTVANLISTEHSDPEVLKKDSTVITITVTVSVFAVAALVRGGPVLIWRGKKRSLWTPLKK